jgi:WD40 repeat protein/tetratricopeptide (TPR) repeat protein
MSETGDLAKNQEPGSEPPARFESVDALRDRHIELLQRAREEGEVPAFWDEVEQFLRRGQATGVLLDSPTDRRASQSLLDYWANRLYRARREPSGATLAEFDLAEAPELPDKPCPYLGLDAFDEKDARFFFGRQQLVAEMVDRLGAQHLLAIVGPSGCGKSSAVMAGLLPRLKAGALPGSDTWRFLGPMVPGSNPVAKLARLFRPPGADPADWDLHQVERFLEDSNHLRHLVEASGDGPVVLIIDQFEELFTLCRDEALRQAFVGNLLALLEAPGGEHRVIVTVRSDFEPYVARLQAFHTHYEKAVLHVPPLSAAELRQAIEGPAREVGLRFEEGLVEALLHDLLGEPAALPLLQFTLLRLWEKRQRNRVSLETYRQEGGGRLALARAADKLYESLIPEEQTTAKRILLRLALPSEGLETTRQRVKRETLFQIGEDPGRIQRVLDRLVEARLVRLTAGGTPGDAQVEIAHEALLRNWPRLAGWLEDEREVIRKRLRLTTAAEQWEASGRDEGALWGGAALDEALRYKDLGDLERQFVEASLAFRDREDAEKEAQRQRDLEQARQLAKVERERAEQAEEHRQEEAQANLHLRRQQIVIGIVAVAALIAFIFALTQLVQANQNADLAEDAQGTAQAQADGRATALFVAGNNLNLASTRQASEVRAKETAVAASAAAATAEAIALAEQGKAENEAMVADSLRLAAQSVANLDSDPQLSLLLAVEATYITHTIQAESALRQALEEARVRAILRKHTAGINALAFDRSGNLLATAGADGTARVWQVATGSQLAVIAHEAPVQVVAFGPDGRWVATGGADGQVRVLEVSNPEAEAFSLGNHSSSVTALAFSPDGRWLTTADQSGLVNVWNVRSWTRVPLPEAAMEVSALALSADGSMLATASYAGTVRLWAVSAEAAAAKPLVVLREHETEVTILTFSPDGRWLATAGADGTVWLWDTASGDEVAVLEGHYGGINAIAFNQYYGTLLATAGEDGTARVWNLRDPELAPLVLLGHSGPVNAVAFMQNGAKLATAGADGTARLWNRYNGEVEAVLRGHEGSLSAVAFQPEGDLLATADSAGVARLWAVAADESQVTLRGDPDGATALAFRPDGSLLATGDYSGTAHLWDVATVVKSGGTGAESVLLPEARGMIFDLAFSPDGQLLAGTAVGGDAERGEAYLWDLSAISGEPFGQDIPVLQLNLEGSVALAVAFGPEGSLLATGSFDPYMMASSVHLWKLNGFAVERLATLDGPPGLPFELAFNPGPVGAFAAGTLLATSVMELDTDAGRLLLWDISRIRDGGDAAPTVANYGMPEGLTFLAFSPDGQALAVSSGNGAVLLWDVPDLLQTGGRGPVTATLSGHDDVAFGLAFSSNGRLLASGAQDGTARLWDVATALESGGSGAEVTVLKGHEGWVFDVAFNPDGRWLATSDEGGVTRLWALDIDELRKVACTHAVRNLSLSEWQEYLGVETPYRQTCPEVRVHASVVEEWVRQGQIDEALDALRQALDLDPTLELTPEEEVARLLQQVAEEYVAQGDPERAVSVLQQAVAIDPSLSFVPEEWVAEALLDRAEYELGSYDDFLAAVTRAVELAPQFKEDAAELLLQFTAYALDEGRISYEDAVAAVELAFGWDPNLAAYGADLLVTIGQGYVDQGTYDQGLALLRQAVEWDPSREPELQLEEARIEALQSAAEGRIGEAVASLEQLPDLAQLGWSTALRVAEAYHTVCRWGLDQGHADQVLGTCQRAIELAHDYGRESMGLVLCIRQELAGLSGDAAIVCEGIGTAVGRLTPGEVVSATLTADQEQFWTFTGRLGQIVSIQMAPASDGFDAVLRLVGPDGTELVERDMRGRGALEGLQVSLPETGTWVVVAEEYYGRPGAYTLTLTVEEE